MKIRFINYSPVLWICPILGFSAILSFLLPYFPVAKRIILRSGEPVDCWMFDSFRYLLPVFVLSFFLLSLFFWRKTGKLLAAKTNSPGTRWASAFRPLAWLPFVVFLSNLGPWIGARAASLFVPYGTATVLAFVLENILSMPSRPSNGLANGWKRGWRRFLPYLLYAVLLFLASLYIGKQADGGDTRHYKIQVESLRKDRDVDVTEEYAHYNKKKLRGSHLKKNKEGRIFSYHSYGFPVLVWLFTSIFGHSSVPLLYAILGSLALAGCTAGTQNLGVPKRTTAIATALLGFSYFWVAVSISFLPEMLGCLCCAWAFWAIPAQHNPRRRLLATAVSVLCCSALPHAHIRFLPPALMLFGFFGLEGLFVADEPFWRRKAPRLALAALFVLASLLLLLHAHRYMYSGGSAYDYKGVLLDTPMAMWGIFADRRGFTPVFPSLLWLVPSSLMMMICLRGRTARWAAMGVLTSAAILITCCATPAALGGACIGGRYFLQAAPILFPIGVLAFSRTDKIGRLWYLFLGTLPVLYLAFMFWNMGGAEFLRVPAPLWWRTPFTGLFQPLCSVLGDTDLFLLFSSFGFTVGLLALSLFLAAPSSDLRGRIPLAALVLVLALASGFVADARGANLWARNDFWHFGRMKMMHAFYSKSAKKAGIVENVGYRTKDLQGPDFIISDAKMPQRSSRAQVSPSSPPNDWLNRKITWCPMRFVPVCNFFFGGLFLSVEGRVVRGSGRLHPIRVPEALRKDNDILLPPNSEFHYIFLIPTTPRHSKCMPFIALDGNEGEIVVDRLDFGPYVPHLEDALGDFPKGAVICDFFASREGEFRIVK